MEVTVLPKKSNHFHGSETIVSMEVIHICQGGFPVQLDMDSPSFRPLSPVSLVVLAFGRVWMYVWTVSAYFTTAFAEKWFWRWTYRGDWGPHCAAAQLLVFGVDWCRRFEFLRPTPILYKGYD